MAANSFVLGSIPTHYEFRLVVDKGTPVPKKKRSFWARGPQEALDRAKELLGISKVPINPRVFRKAGGVCLKKILINKKKKSEDIYPF